MVTGTDLVRHSGATFHTTRALAAASSAAALAIVVVSWSVSTAWLALALALVATADALYRRSHPTQTIALRLALDATILGLAVLVIGGPALIAAPYAYLLSGALLFLPLRRALAVIAYFTAFLAAVYFAGVPAAQGGYQLAASVLALCVFLGAAAILLLAAARAVRSLRESQQHLLAKTRERLHYEHAIARSAQVLLTSRGEDPVGSALTALVQATGATLGYAARVIEDPLVGLVSSVEYEERGSNGGPRRRDSLLWSDMPKRLSVLSSDSPFVSTDETEASEPGFYEIQQPVSELVLPIQTGDSWAGLIGFLDTDGSRTWAEADVELLRAGAGMIGAFWERQQHREALEDLVRSKDDFVAAVSHELRTPLTVVVGLAEELRHTASIDQDEAAELAGLIADQGAEIANLVEDLLVAARAEIGTLAISPEPVDVRSEVDTTIADCIGRSQSPATSIEAEGNQANAWADPIRVRQILRNLITNAMRYGGDDIRVAVALLTDRVVVSVSDNGPGVPEKDRDRIFEPYEQSGTSRQRPDSVGIGLAVSRQLAELMGGELTYRRSGNESVFELTLPTAVSSVPILVP